MPKILYTPRLSADVVRALYSEGQRRGMPMTRLADYLLRQSLDALATTPVALRLCEEEPAEPPSGEPDAA